MTSPGNDVIENEVSMFEVAAPTHAPLSPQANLRVTFWGVQGSCPVFPTPEEIHEYNERITTLAIQQTLLDIARRMDEGRCSAAVLRELSQPANAVKYLRDLNLPELPIYGGDTTCVEVKTREGDIILFDMGTGIRDFSRHSVAGSDGSNHLLHIFATHEHLDHRNGLSFASFCFEKSNPYQVRLFSTRKVLQTLDDRYGIFSHRLTPATHVDDPLDYRILSAKFSGVEIRSDSFTLPAPEAVNWTTLPVNQSIQIGQTSVTPFEVYHGDTQCLGYQVRHGNSSFVFCTDHELRHGADPNDPRQIRSNEADRRLAEYCQNVDVAYFDGQYLRAEYDGREGIGSGPGIPRMDWGHGCIEDIVARVQQCNIRRAFVGHHDPERSWGQRLELDGLLSKICAEKKLQITLARASSVIEF